MNIIKSNIDSVYFKKNLSSNILDSGLFAYDIPINEKSLVFLDTNILLWIYRINGQARDEFFLLMHSLKESNRLFIPSWVIHEYNYFLEKGGSDLFSPFNKSMRDIESTLNYIKKQSKLVVDDEYLKGSQYPEKQVFFSKLDDTTKELQSLVKALYNPRNKNITLIQEQIEELVDGCILNSNINDILNESCVDIRFQNNICVFRRTRTPIPAEVEHLSCLKHCPVNF